MVTTPRNPSNQICRVRDALARAVERLEAAPLWYGHGTDNAWDEAVLLVLTAAGLPPDASDEVLDERLPEEAVGRIDSLLTRRIDERLPLPYLLGRAWFADLEFRCDARALVPRSPLAEVIRHDYAPWGHRESGRGPRRLLDLCCGGGALGIAAAVFDEDLTVTLADLSPDALDLARENIALHGVDARVTAVQSDLFEALGGQTFDIILCNPPYVNAADLAAMPAEYHAEPPMGLGSGADGLDLARRILCTAADHLEPEGLLFLELGNSWTALDEALSDLPLTWIEFAEGGEGVLVATLGELAAISARFRT